jgi:hypothetical protein
VLAGSAQAAELLPAGQPAGVARAQAERSYTWLYVTGGVLVFAGVGFLIAHKNTDSVIKTITNGGDKEQIVVSPNSTVSSTGSTN